jgi:hypothetical protein
VNADMSDRNALLNQPQPMRTARNSSTRTKPENFVEPGGRGLIRPKVEPIEVSFCRTNHFADELAADPAATEFRVDVQVTNPSRAFLREVRISVEAANRHDLVANQSHKQGLANLRKPIRAAIPFIKQSAYEPVSLRLARYGESGELI